MSKSNLLTTDDIISTEMLAGRFTKEIEKLSIPFCEHMFALSHETTKINGVPIAETGPETVPIFLSRQVVYAHAVGKHLRAIGYTFAKSLPTNMTLVCASKLAQDLIQGITDGANTEVHFDFKLDVGVPEKNAALEHVVQATIRLLTRVLDEMQQDAKNAKTNEHRDRPTNKIV